MLDTEVGTLEVAGGAVPTNCLVAAYAAGDIEDLGQALRRRLNLKQTYAPRKEKTQLYRRQYVRREALLQGLNEAVKK
jgi:xylulokinase